MAYDVFQNYSHPPAWDRRLLLNLKLNLQSIRIA